MVYIYTHSGLLQASTNRHQSTLFWPWPSRKGLRYPSSDPSVWVLFPWLPVVTFRSALPTSDCPSVCLSVSPAGQGTLRAGTGPPTLTPKAHPDPGDRGSPINICKMSKFTAASPRGLFPVGPSGDRCTHIPTPSPHYFPPPAVRPISTSAHQARRAPAGGAAQLKS